MKKIICVFLSLLIVSSFCSFFNLNIFAEENHSHEFTEWVEGSKGTCVKKGYIKRTCKICGYEDTVETSVNKEIHENTEVRNFKASTCQNPGYTGDTYCSDCGKQLAIGYSTDIIPHDYQNPQVESAATCSSQGKIVETCSMCGRKRITYTDKDKTNHTGKETIQNKVDASCETDGYTGDTVCSDCGEIIKKGEIIKANGHNFSDWTVEKKANCHESGLMKRVCSICGETETKTVEINSSVHDGETEIKFKSDPTCTENGYSGDIYCVSCGKKISSGRSISKLGHKFSESKIEKDPSCSEEGKSVKICERCGEKEYDSIPKTDHQFSDWTVEKKANCHESGLMKRVCSICGETETKTVEINSSVHDGETEIKFKSDPTCTENGYSGDIYCVSCGKKISSGRSISKLGHKFSDSETEKEPSCSEEGKSVRICERCGEKEYDSIPKTDHQFSVWIVSKKANCHEYGEKTRKCGLCGLTETDVISIDSNNHDGGTYVMNKFDPDCVNGGYSGDIMCSGCRHKIISGVKIKALGHNYGEWTVTKSATYYENGSRYRICSVCKSREDEKITRTKRPLIGDVTLDGKVTALDARTALRISANLYKAKSEQSFAQGDLNLDRKITALEARKILRVSAKLDNFDKE